MATRYKVYDKNRQHIASTTGARTANPASGETRHRYFALVLLMMTFIACDYGRVSHQELEAHIRSDGNSTLSRMKSIILDNRRGDDLPCAALKKEADEFRVRAKHQIGRLINSHVPSHLTTPEKAARANATKIYYEYSDGMRKIYDKCVSGQKQIQQARAGQ